MEPKNFKIFNEKNIQTVKTFCEYNNIDNIDEFIYRCFKQGFDIERFGYLGNEGVKPKEIIKEVIVEKEIIKEVEKIVEVPVEKIVTKIEYINDKTGESELLEKIEQLEENIFHLTQELEEERQFFSTKTTETENIFQNEMSKKDKELDELRRNLDIHLDDTNTKMLQETLLKLKKEITKKDNRIKELEELNNKPTKAIFMRGSNLNDTI